MRKNHKCSMRRRRPSLQLTMTSVQYSLTTCPSVTVVPLTSMIQNSAVNAGLADTSQRSATLRSPSVAEVAGHLINGRSETNNTHTHTHTHTHSLTHSLAVAMPRPTGTL